MRVAGLSEIAGRYDLLLCDVFGTLHDARETFPEALDALTRFRSGGGTVVLVSNAADPGPKLATALAIRGIAGFFDALATSGDVARALIREQGPKTVFHIGPRRDQSLFEGLGCRLSGPEADLIVCTGYPEANADLDDALNVASRRGATMLCTNPDTALRIGEQELRFAGLVADRYRTIGGVALNTGKPGGQIYRAALDVAQTVRKRGFASERVLGLGDTPGLDAWGALAAGFSAALLAPEGALSPDLPGVGRRYRMPALVWEPIGP